MKILAAIEVVLKLFECMIQAGLDSDKHLSRVKNLLEQMKKLSGEPIRRMVEGMNYVEALFIRDELPPVEEVIAYLDRVVPIIINCDVVPDLKEIYPGDKLKIVEHKQIGQLKWDPSKLHFHRPSKDMEGAELLFEIESQENLVLNICFMAWFLEDTNRIPKEWDDLTILFLGTQLETEEGVLLIGGIQRSGYGEKEWKSFCVELSGSRGTCSKTYSVATYRN